MDLHSLVFLKSQNQVLAVSLCVRGKETVVSISEKQIKAGCPNFVFYMHIYTLHVYIFQKIFIKISNIVLVQGRRNNLYTLWSKNGNSYGNSF